MTTTTKKCLVLLLVLLIASISFEIAGAKPMWKLTQPIVTFIPGPPVTDQSAKLMKEGSWNVV